MNIGKYEILGEIGKGGFGTVYRARDTILNREVALKVLKPAWLDDKNAVERFYREAQAAAQLDHPNIVTIYDMGEQESRLFIAMKLVDGEPLNAYIKRAGPLTLEAALPIINNIASALEYAHSKGMVHRDVKPGNILVRKDGVALLTDFGLVRWTEQVSIVSQNSTGNVMGTPEYIAPEIWDGKPATAASDVYALGCVIYEMLTGKALFAATSQAAIMRSHFNDPDLSNVGNICAQEIIQITTFSKSEERITARDLLRIENQARQKASQPTTILSLSIIGLEVLRMLRASLHKLSTAQIAAEIGFLPVQIQPSIQHMLRKAYIKQDSHDTVPPSSEDATFFTKPEYRQHIDALLTSSHVDSPDSSIKCRICKSSVRHNIKFCPQCGFPIHQDKSQSVVLDGYPHRKVGPESTFFPPASCTFWPAIDLAEQQPRGLLSNESSQSMYWMPPITLDAGEYDIAIVGDGKQPCEVCVIADADDLTTTRISVSRGARVEPANCVRLALGERVEAVWLGMQVDPSSSKFEGILLIPRLGLIWHGNDLQHESVSDGGGVYGESAPGDGWRILAAHSKDRLLIYGNYMTLESGTYTAVFRLACANWSHSGPLLKLDIWSVDGLVQESTIDTSHVITQAQFQDHKFTFHLIQRTERLEFRLRTLAPADVTVAFVRLLTTAEVIAERYFELGGSASRLGVPFRGIATAAPAIHDQLPPTMGCFQRYSAGSIYWTGKVGTCEVYGQLGYLYEELGGTGSALGFPISPIQSVISSYGTCGSIQEYEYGVICSSNWPWGHQTHEVYGGIAHTYRRMGTHTSSLGFPLSSELWHSRDDGIRRCYFEGGYIDWSLTRGELAEISYYPRPIIEKVDIPQQVYVGQQIIVRLEAKNVGGNASEGYLTLAFPDLGSGEPPIATSDVHCYVSKPGEKTNGSYGTAADMILQHYRAESVRNPWNANESHWLEVVINASKAGQFRILLRATATNSMFDKYTRLGQHIGYEADPLPTSGGIKDQDEFVRVYTVEVLEHPLPDLQFERRMISPLIAGRSNILEVTITNRGLAPAKNIAISSPSLLDEQKPRALRALAPGASGVLKLNVVPRVEGQINAAFTLSYDDDQSNHYNEELEADLHSGGNQAPFELKIVRINLD